MTNNRHENAEETLHNSNDLFDEKSNLLIRKTTLIFNIIVQKTFDPKEKDPFKIKCITKEEIFNAVKMTYKEIEREEVYQILKQMKYFIPYQQNKDKETVGFLFCIH